MQTYDGCICILMLPTDAAKQQMLPTRNDRLHTLR